MSNFRDLQKLRNIKNVQNRTRKNSRQHNPQTGRSPFSNFPQSGLHLRNNAELRPFEQYFSFLESKELVPRLRESKPVGHYREDSAQNHEKKEDYQQISRTGMSIYNFGSKPTDRRSNPLTSRKEKAEEIYQQPNTYRNFQKKGFTNKLPNSGTTNSGNFGNGGKLIPMEKSHFSVIYPIGKGGFGKVWKIQMKKTRQVFALKQMLKAKIIQKKSINSVMNERQLLAVLKHPFLVNMHYAFQDRENLYLIMDYLNGGDLRYHIGQRRNFSERETKFFLASLILGLEYMHSNNIIHRDIKPQNLVLDQHGYMRITDLGVSRIMREDNSKDTSGTPGYMAPQVICNKPHSFTADYFAVGVIAYEFMLGHRPYNGSNRRQIKQQIISKQASVRLDQLPYKWSTTSMDFINNLLTRNAANRLGSGGIAELKNHPWLCDIDWVKLSKKQLKAPFVPISIEDDYEKYKEQISEDTLVDPEQTMLMLRNQEVQSLFEGYYFEKQTNRKKSTIHTTNTTEEEKRG